MAAELRAVTYGRGNNAAADLVARWLTEVRAEALGPVTEGEALALIRGLIPINAILKLPDADYGKFCVSMTQEALNAILASRRAPASTAPVPDRALEEWRAS